jgi:phospholipase C
MQGKAMNMPPSFDLQQIKTVVIVMMENRSFDHMLGHLSLPPFGARTDVTGLSRTSWTSYANDAPDERPHMPFAMRSDPRLPHDQPHERSFVATQIGPNREMTGFVRAYYDFAEAKSFSGVVGQDHPSPMGFFTPEMVPITDFLAQNFCVCDHWFAPLPASTMPNRLMFLAGDAHVDLTSGLVLDPGPLLLDWLSARRKTWRVYHDGLFSFFTLFLRPDVLGPNFKRFTSLAADLAADDVPEVILIEPTYHDAPHFHANDNHPPLQIGAGEHFLRDVYDVLTGSKQWSNMLVVFTHDEHGGFFDHVPPPKIPYSPPNGATYTDGFPTTGPRVPAIVASPFVSRKAYNGVFDHTSILQFLAERFDPTGPGYSDTVNARKGLGIESLSAVLSPAAPATLAAASVPPAPDSPPEPFRVESILTPGSAGTGALGAAFVQAGQHYMTNHLDEAREKLPELWHILR